MLISGRLKKRSSRFCHFPLRSSQFSSEMPSKSSRNVSVLCHPLHTWPWCLLCSYLLSSAPMAWRVHRSLSLSLRQIPHNLITFPEAQPTGVGSWAGENTEFVTPSISAMSLFVDRIVTRDDSSIQVKRAEEMGLHTELDRQSKFDLQSVFDATPPHTKTARMYLLIRILLRFYHWCSHLRDLSLLRYWKRPDFAEIYGKNIN